MINHARTLLLNITGATALYSGIPGEEIIDPTFAAMPLPTTLRSVYQALFGSNPDRAMLNYRSKQLLSVMHATVYEPYITTLDSRITYLSNTNQELYSDSTFLPKISTINNSGNASLSVIGTPPAPDDSGKVMQAWHITVLSSSVVNVITQSAPYNSVNLNYTMVNGLSLPLTLPSSSLQFVFNGGTNAEWQLNTLARPQRDVCQVLQHLQSLGATTLLALFGVNPVEPYLTLNKLWTDSPRAADKLAGILLAYIYRLEEIRTNHG